VFGWKRWFLAGSKDLFVIPGGIVFFERSIKRSEFAVDHELGYNVFFPISSAGVHSLRSEMAEVDSVLMMDTTRRRRAVSHHFVGREIRQSTER